MPSPALSDPRRERAANDELAAPLGRCPVCHRPHESRGKVYSRKPGPRPTYCGPRCRVFAWRRDGDPDGPLNHSRAQPRRY